VKERPELASTLQTLRAHAATRSSEPLPNRTDTWR
jgi:hypothetical protein